jgi:TetR/AcrR family transcriptional regulator, tetracycline repressor protein
MTKAPDFELDAEEIVTAAVEIFEESGLDAVSMRSVSSRLGVSPIPLYSRIGNKDALVEAIADRLLADLAPPRAEGEPWDQYAVRWARELRARLRRARDSRLILWPGRDAYVEASRPLVEAMRRDGLAADAAVQACRLLTWATVGFGAVEAGAEPPARGRRRGRPGGDPGGVDAAEADTLFDLNIRYVIGGITGDAAAEHTSSRTTKARATGRTRAKAPGRTEARAAGRAKATGRAGGR